jgi:putative flavoprotein involved in K+ transport
VANVIWATGYTPGFSWIDLPVFGEREPLHTRGVVTSEPGLYFIGLDFLYAVSSAMIHGVSRDAQYIVQHIASRSETATPRVTSGSPDGANSYASR